MGDGIQIHRVAEQFSSHTQMRGRPRRHSAFADTRTKLIAAFVEVVAEGGDPRLNKSRTRS
jgi:hypothetical protein